MSPELLPDATRERHARLDRRLHDVTWGLLLLMTGVIWLFPSSQIPEGAWLVGVAAILLGMNVVRHYKAIGVNGFTVGLGLIALIAALARTWRADLPLLALCFIIIGAGLLFKPLLTRAT